MGSVIYGATPFVVRATPVLLPIDGEFLNIKAYSGINHFTFHVFQSPLCPTLFPEEDKIYPIDFINRPGLAEAVLQTPSSFIH